MRRWFASWVAWLIAALPFIAVLSPGEALYFRDHTTAFRRAFALVGEAYRAGRLPLWDPLVGGGEPLAAWPMAVAFSPLHVLTAWAPAALDPYDLFVCALYLIAGAGMYTLARVAGLEVRHKVAASVLFVAGGPLISFNNLLPLLHSAAFAPWTLAAALDVWRAPRARSIALLALALALHLEGIDPAFAVCDVLVFAGLLVFVPVPRDAVPRRGAALLAAAVLGAGVAMIRIVPLLDLLHGTARATGYAAAPTWSMHPLQLAELSFAGLSGDFLDLHTLFQGVEGGRHFLASLYISALALPALAIALLTPRLRVLAVVMLLCVLIALGPATPLHALVQVVFPGASSSRFPVKYVYGAALVAPLMVPLALDRLLAARASLQLGVLGGWTLLATALMVAPASWVMVHADGFGLDEEGVAALLAGASSQTLLITGAVLITGVLARRRPEWAWALPLILAVDVSLAARPILPTMPRLPDEPSAVARLVLADHRQPSIFRYESPAPHLDMVADTQRGFDVLEPMGASPFGIRSVLDTDLGDIRPPVWRKLHERFFQEQHEPARLRVLARIGVTHLLVTARRRDLPGLRYVGTATVPNSLPISVFRIEEARAPVGFEAHLTPVEDFDAAYHALTSSTGPRLVALSADLGELPRGAARTGTVTGALDALTVESDGPGWVVVAQRFDKGWRAHLDGRAVPVIAADLLTMAVPVPGGRHQLRLEYAPPAMRWGAALSALALLVVLGLVWWPRRGRSS